MRKDEKVVVSKFLGRTRASNVLHWLGHFHASTTDTISVSEHTDTGRLWDMVDVWRPAWSTACGLWACADDDRPH